MRRYCLFQFPLSRMQCHQIVQSPPATMCRSGTKLSRPVCFATLAVISSTAAVAVNNTKTDTETANLAPESRCIPSSSKELWSEVSLWMEQALADEVSAGSVPRVPLEGHHSYDVAIVGGGFTGLWTAYYLQEQSERPLRICVLEAETVGYGASGRNGGWLMDSLANVEGIAEKEKDLDRRREVWSIVKSGVDEVKAVVEKENIDCNLVKGGMFQVAARYPEQENVLSEQFQGKKDLGGNDNFHHSGPDEWLDKSNMAKHLRIDSDGGIFSPNFATIQPARLVRGLAKTLETKKALGCVDIFEQSRVVHWEAGKVQTAKGTVSAGWVVLAVEGYAPDLKGAIPLGRYQIPIQSLIIATQPLSPQLWEECIGLKHGQCFCDAGRLVTYGMRSKDDRLVFGMRGTYLFGSKPRTDFKLTQQEKDLRCSFIHDFFPKLLEHQVTVTHAWGGNLGMSRRMSPHMFIDPSNHVAIAGGYLGEGVSATNLSGRTLAALMLDVTDNAKQSCKEAKKGSISHEVLMRQPWVVHGDITSTFQSGLRMWEPEPFRWLGYKAIFASYEIENAVLSNAQSSAWRRRAAVWLADMCERILST